MVAPRRAPHNTLTRLSALRGSSGSSGASKGQFCVCVAAASGKLKFNWPESSKRKQRAKGKLINAACLPPPHLRCPAFTFCLSSLRDTTANTQQQEAAQTVPQTEKHGEGVGGNEVCSRFLAMFIACSVASYLRLWAPNLPTLTDTFSASFSLSLSLSACHLSRPACARSQGPEESTPFPAAFFGFCFSPKVGYVFFRGQLRRYI